MTTYDATGLDPRPIPAPPDHDRFGWNEEATPAPPETTDTLDLLRQAVGEQVEIEPVVIPVPGNPRLRLVCHTDITTAQITRWQKAAVPAHVRKTGKWSENDINPLHLSVAALTSTLLRIEVADVRNPGEWLPVEDSREGRPLTFEDQAVLTMFGAIDTITALRKVFGREAVIVKAGQKVLKAAGWSQDGLGDDVDEESDPT